MKRILTLIVGICLLPSASFAVETSSAVFDDASSFTVAAIAKLGTKTDSAFAPGVKNIEKSSSPKEKEQYECVKDAGCPGDFVCRSNKCIDPCLGVSCASGQKCSKGSCVSCPAGATDCGCASPAVANGSGSCIDSCNPNKCGSTTPTCTRTGNKTTYSCACTSTSCGAGKQCSGGVCSNCAANTQCSCPSGYVANGGGGCAKPTCNSNSDCSSGKICSNPGKMNASCTNCGVNSTCTCPSGYVANGSGSCVKPACSDNTVCGEGKQCTDPGKYNAKCSPCTSGTQCTCPSGQLADGSGGCKGAIQSYGERAPGTCANDKIQASRTFTTPIGTIQQFQKGGRWCRNGESSGTSLAFPGNYWIGHEAYLGGGARIWGNAVVYESAWVTNKAQVYDNAQVFGKATVGSPNYTPQAWTGESPKVYGSAKVYGNVYVYGGSEVYGNAQVYGNAKVSGTAKIGGNARVCGNTVITSGTITTCQKQYCSDCP